MSVCHVLHLLETAQYRSCLEEAMALLAMDLPEGPDRARLLAAVCRCRVELGDWRAAAEAGVQALALAESGADADALGSALVDLGTARLRLRQYAGALDAWQRFLVLLPNLTGLSCQEGLVRRNMADVLQRLGHAEKAMEAYGAARRWFQRFGDEQTAWECARAVIRIALEIGDLKRALAVLKEGDRQMGAADPSFQSDQLLDWARYLLAAGRPLPAAGRAFAALELADDLERQGRAQLLLCQAAQAQEKPVEAFAFALAARVSAMEGGLYSLEFDAAEVIFRLLRQHGPALLAEVAADFERQGVDIYDYLSELAVRRCTT